MSIHLDDVPSTKLYTSKSTGTTPASAGLVWQAIESIGGDLDWYAWSIGWGVRGLLDSAAGGPGVRLERPARQHLQPGDVVDWWRVEAVEPGRLLRLKAETKLPGVAWLDLSVRPGSAGGTRTTIELRTSFAPHGPAGQLYWLSILPAHGLVFGGMRRRITRAAETAAST